MKDNIGKVTLNYDYYCGQDLYSDGDEAEEHILDIVKNEEGYEYFHPDYENWPVMYHLTRQRENIAAPMALKKTDTLLEIGAGMGAVTGAFARRCARVDCIELSKRRSLINAYRHRDCDNLQIYVGNFQNIRLEEKYDVITLIGVLEYAYHYIDGEKPYQSFLKQLARYLKANGKLYIAIENKLGIKYFSGYHEDHLGIPFVGLQGYHKSDNVRTFTRSEIQELLVSSGFSRMEFYYPFPDYKLPTVIYHESIMKDAELDFAEYHNYDLPILHLFNTNQVMKALKGTDEREMLANSFLIEAGF